MRALRGFLIGFAVLVPSALLALGVLAFFAPSTIGFVGAVGGWPAVVVGSGAVGLVLAAGLLAVGASPQIPPLAWSTMLKAHLERYEAESLGIRKNAERRIAELTTVANEARRRAEDETLARKAAEHNLQQFSAGVEHLPKELLLYYGNGVRSHGSEEIRALARSITSPWRAVEGTMSVELLEPFFEQVQRVVKDREAPNPIHHYSGTEVLRMFEQISDAWRKDEWFQKALRWMEQRYGSR